MRQKIVVTRFEILGDAEQARLAREYLVMCEKRLELAREGFEAWRRGDLATIEAMLAPDVRWGWFEAGPWDCRSREDVMARLRERFSEGFAGEIVRRRGASVRANVASGRIATSAGG